MSRCLATVLLWPAQRALQQPLGNAPGVHQKMKVIVAIEDPAVIKRILAHLDNRQGAGQYPEHPLRARPQLALPGQMEQVAGSPTRLEAGPHRPRHSALRAQCSRVLRASAL